MIQNRVTQRHYETTLLLKKKKKENSQFLGWAFNLMPNKPVIISDLAMKEFQANFGKRVFSAAAIKLAGFVTVQRYTAKATELEASLGVRTSMLELTWRDVYPVYKVSARNFARPVPQIFREKTFDWFSARSSLLKQPETFTSAEEISVSTTNEYLFSSVILLRRFFVPRQHGLRV